MALRNFWLEAEIEGRQTPLAGGPRGRDGKMCATIYVKSAGLSRRAVSVECRVNKEGKNEVSVFNADGIRIYVKEVEP